MLDTWLRETIAFQLCIEASTIKEDSDLTDLGADSLDIVELLMAVEEEYDIRIPDDKVSLPLTFAGLKGLVECSS